MSGFEAVFCAINICNTRFLKYGAKIMQLIMGTPVYQIALQDVLSQFRVVKADRFYGTRQFLPRNFYIVQLAVRSYHRLHENGYVARPLIREIRYALKKFLGNNVPIVSSDYHR